MRGADRRVTQRPTSHKVPQQPLHGFPDPTAMGGMMMSPRSTNAERNEVLIKHLEAQDWSISGFARRIAARCEATHLPYRVAPSIVSRWCKGATPDVDLAAAACHVPSAALHRVVADSAATSAVTVYVVLYALTHPGVSPRDHLAEAQALAPARGHVVRARFCDTIGGTRPGWAKAQRAIPGGRARSTISSSRACAVMTSRPSHRGGLRSSFRASPAGKPHRGHTEAANEHPASSLAALGTSRRPR